MIFEFLADGFEETEAIVPLDILRRAGKSVTTVGVTGKTVTGSHGITVTADTVIAEAAPGEALEAVILPGGMPGTANLEKSEEVIDFIKYADSNGKIIGAICAAPSIIGKMGLLGGKKAVCYPGFEQFLYGAEIGDAPAVKSGNIITARGAGAATQFGFALVEAMCGRAKRVELEHDIQWSR